MITKKQTKNIGILLGIVFGAFMFSCCSAPVAHAEMSDMDSDHHAESCCNVLENQVMLLFHNQPIFLLDSSSLLNFIILSVLALFFVFLTFVIREIKKFILYEKLLRRHFGSIKLFNLFTLIFSKGILHSKIF